MMYNETDENSSLHYYNIYINLFYLIFGNLANLLKIVFFLEKPIRSLPCTIPILFCTFSDFITLNNLPVLQLLIHLFPKYDWIKVTVDWSNYRNETILLSYSVSTYDIIMCKIRSYLHMLSTDLSFLMLLFASINRYCSSHTRKKHQNNPQYLIKYFCNRPNVYHLCIIASLTYGILSLQHLFNFTINSPSEGCVPHNRILWGVWISSIHCFLLPILMIFFGLLALQHIHYLSIYNDYSYCLQCQRSHRKRKRKHRFLELCPQCSRCHNSIQYQIEKQLTYMIISEVFVTVLTSLPSGIYAFYYLLHNVQNQTIYYTKRTQWTLAFIRMCMYFEPSCGFYIYLLSLSILRKRFLQMIIKKTTTMSFWCASK